MYHVAYLFFDLINYYN